MALSEVSTFFQPGNVFWGSLSLLLSRVKDRGCCTLSYESLKGLIFFISSFHHFLIHFKG